MKRLASIADFSVGDGPLVGIDASDRIPLPPPFDDPEAEPTFDPLSRQSRER